MNRWHFDQKIDLNYPTGIMGWPNMLMYEGDREAHEWRVQVQDGGNPVDMGEYSIMAYFDRCDGKTVAVSGTSDGNVVNVVLPQSVYAVPGPLLGVLRVSRDGSKMTLAVGRWTVWRAPGDDYIDPGEVVPDLTDLMDRIAEMERATSAANLAADQAQTAAQEASAACETLTGEVAAATQAASAATQAAATSAQAADETMAGIRGEFDAIKADYEKRNVFVTPEMFGAVGDGETDDTAAIQAAINAADRVVFGNKTYLVDNVQFDKSVELVGGTNTVIRTNTRHHAFYCASARPKATLALTEGYVHAYSEGNCCASKIAVSDASQVEIGDVMRIYSSELFNPCRSYYYKGATVIATDVDRENNLVYIGFVMPFDFSAEGAYVQVFRGNELQVRNIRFESTLNDEDSGTSFGLYMQGCANSRIENCTFDGFTHNLYLDCCVNVSIRACSMGHAKRQGGLEWDGYGICIGCCTNTRIEHVTARCGQSAITTGGSNPVVPVFNTHITDCQLFSEYSGRALGCHDNNYDITIDNSLVAGAWLAGNACVRNTRFVPHGHNGTEVMLTGNDGVIDNIFAFDHVTFDAGMRVGIRAFSQWDAKFSNDIGRVVFNNCFGGWFWIQDQTENELVTGSTIKSITVNNWLGCERFFMEYGTIETLKVDGLRFDQVTSDGRMRNRRIEIGANCQVLNMVYSEDVVNAYDELALKASAIEADEIVTKDMEIRAADNTRLTSLTVYGKAEEALRTDTIVFDGDNLIPGLNGFSIEVADTNVNGPGSPLHFKNFSIPKTWRNRTYIASAMIDATNASARMNNIALWFYDYNGNMILNVNGAYDRSLFLSEAKVTIPDDACTMTIGARLYASESGVTGRYARAYDFKFFSRDELLVNGVRTLQNMPVESGGNYTDEAGQQYLCNYIDCKQSLQYRCVELFFYHVVQAAYLTDMSDYFAEGIVGGFIPREIVKQGYIGRKLDRYISALPILNTATPPVDAESIWVSDGGIGFAVSVETAGARTMEALAACIRSMTEPILCEMNIVQMHAISQTTTTQYNGIRLYSGKTRVYSKGGSYFKLGYYRDTKDYVDMKIAASAPGRYELVQDITLTEEQSAIRLDGLSLKKMVIFSNVKFVEGTGTYGLTYINDSIRHLAFGDTCNATDFTRGFLHLDCSDGLLMSQSSANIGNNYSFGISKQPFKSAYEPVLMDSFTSIQIGSLNGYKFAPESRFIIYGVRA